MELKIKTGIRPGSSVTGLNQDSRVIAERATQTQNDESDPVAVGSANGGDGEKMMTAAKKRQATKLHQNPLFFLQRSSQKLVAFGLFLVKGMMEDFGNRMHCQFLEIIRTLLDANALCGFLRKPEVLLNICELLCFCIMQDASRTKCSFLQNNVTEEVLHLTRRKEKSLVVAAIRFVRTLLSVHDDYVLNYVVKNNMLKPIIDVFIANGKQYNLLNSAVLDLLEHIRKGKCNSVAQIHSRYILGPVGPISVLDLHSGPTLMHSTTN